MPLHGSSDPWIRETRCSKTRSNETRARETQKGWETSSIETKTIYSPSRITNINSRKEGSICPMEAGSTQLGRTQLESSRALQSPGHSQTPLLKIEMHLKIDARAAGRGVSTLYKPSPDRNTPPNTNQHHGHEAQHVGAYCRSRTCLFSTWATSRTCPH